MKKVLVLLIAFILSFSIMGCEKDTEVKNPNFDKILIQNIKQEFDFSTYTLVKDGDKERFDIWISLKSNKYFTNGSIKAIQNLVEQEFKQYDNMNLKVSIDSGDHVEFSFENGVWTRKNINNN